MSENSEKKSERVASRLLFDHKNNKFNRECITISTSDDRASDNANHEYQIVVHPLDKDSGHCVDGKPVEICNLKFQNGGLKEVGANGITDQALLAIILDRVRSFNEGQFRCRENSMIITKGEEMLMWMEKRSNDRARRNVEGERLQ